MASKGEFRARAQRFLTGRFVVEDLTSLFLFLRNYSYGNQAARDLGHVLGHADTRNQGITVERISDMYRVARYAMVRLGNDTPQLQLDDAPPDFFEAMHATLRLLKDDILFRHTGMRKDQASTALTRLRRHFDIKPNGRFALREARSVQKYERLMLALTSFIISEPAYTPSQLYEETSNLLVRHGLITDDQIFLLDQKKPHLFLFALAAMHLVEYALPDGATATAYAGWATHDEATTLLVSADMKVPFKGQQVSIGFPIFATDLAPAEWTSEYDPSRRHASFTLPLELTAEVKLRTIE